MGFPMELAREIARSRGEDPDEPVLMLDQDDRHGCMPNWQQYLAVARATLAYLK